MLEAEGGFVEGQIYMWLAADCATVNGLEDVALKAIAVLAGAML